MCLEFLEGEELENYYQEVLMKDESKWVTPSAEIQLERLAQGLPRKMPPPKPQKIPRSESGKFEYKIVHGLNTINMPVERFNKEFEEEAVGIDKSGKDWDDLINVSIMGGTVKNKKFIPNKLEASDSKKHYKQINIDQFNRLSAEDQKKAITKDGRLLIPSEVETEI